VHVYLGCLIAEMNQPGVLLLSQDSPWDRQIEPGRACAQGAVAGRIVLGVTYRHRKGDRMPKPCGKSRGIPVLAIGRCTIFTRAAIGQSSGRVRQLVLMQNPALCPHQLRQEFNLSPRFAFENIFENIKEK